MRAGSQINTLTHSENSLVEDNIKLRHFRKQSMPDPTGQKEEHTIPLETSISREKKKKENMMEGGVTLTQRGFISSEKVSPLHSKITSLNSSPKRISTLNNSLQ